jgi:flagellar basal body-associated protein FliL
MKKLLPILIPVIAAILGIAIGGFVIGPMLIPKPPAVEPQEGVLYSLGKMQINLDEMAYIVIMSPVLEFRDQKTLDEITKKDPNLSEIKNIIIRTLAKYKPEDFVGDKRRATMAAVVEAINNFYGDKVVLRIFVTELLISKLPQ